MATIASIQALISARQNGNNNTVASERALWSIILSQFFIGEVKWLKFTSAQVTENFDSTGLGTSSAFLGWAVCNGNNGTTNDDGKVSVAFGSVYNTLGATGGSKDAVVVSHTHALSAIKSYNNVQGTNGFYDRSNGAAASGITTDTAGVSGTDKNMQPYIVELKIIRIS